MSKFAQAEADELAMRARRVAQMEQWSHKNEGTPETHAYAARVEQSSLYRLMMSGDINEDQKAWAEEIGIAAEMIERDVAVKIVDYTPRIDCGASGRDVLVEGIISVRRQIAYTWWRERIQQPKRAILDMLTGEPKSFSAIAREYHMHKRRAKRLLIASIDLWPDAMEFAEKEADAASIAAAHAGLI